MSLPAGFRVVHDPEDQEGALPPGFRVVSQQNPLQRAIAGAHDAAYDALRVGSVGIDALQRSGGRESIAGPVLGATRSAFDRAANIVRPEGATPRISAGDADLVRQGASFGASDEFEAGFDATVGELARSMRGDRLRPAEAHDQTLDALQAGVATEREARPNRAMAMELTGAVASPVNRALGPLATGSRTLGGALARGASVGGGAGGAYGFLSEDGDLEDRFDAAWKSALAGAAIGGPLNAAAHRLGAASRRPTPSAADQSLPRNITRAARQGGQAVGDAYERAFVGDPRLRAGDANRLARRARQTLAEHSPAALGDEAGGRASARIQALYDDNIATMIDESVTLRDVDLILTDLQSAKGKGPAAQAARRLGRTIKDALGEVAEDAALDEETRSAIRSLFAAREMARRNFITQDIARLLERSPRDIGQNQASTIRAGLRRIAERAAKMGASPDEVAMIERAANGSAMRNMFSLLGHFSPTRIGGMVDVPLAGGALAMGNVPLAAGAGGLMAGGFASQLAANQMARGAAAGAARAIAAGRAPAVIGGSRAFVPAAATPAEEARRRAMQRRGLIGRRSNPEPAR